MDRKQNRDNLEAIYQIIKHHQGKEDQALLPRRSGCIARRPPVRFLRWKTTDI